MIEVANECLITLKEAARMIPRRRGKPGQKVSVQTVTAWIIRGKRGVVLEALRDPSGWLTTVQAVERFLKRLAELERGNGKAAPPVPARKSWGRQFLEQQGVLPADGARGRGG